MFWGAFYSAYHSDSHFHMRNQDLEKLSNLLCITDQQGGRVKIHILLRPALKPGLLV